jgi:hypothetical protein
MHKTYTFNKNELLFEIYYKEKYKIYEIYKFEYEFPSWSEYQRRPFVRRGIPTCVADEVYSLLVIYTVYGSKAIAQTKTFGKLVWI